MAVRFGWIAFSFFGFPAGFWQCVPGVPGWFSCFPSGCSSALVSALPPCVGCWCLSGLGVPSSFLAVAPLWWFPLSPSPVSSGALTVGVWKLLAVLLRAWIYGRSPSSAGSVFIFNVSLLVHSSCSVSSDHRHVGQRFRRCSYQGAVALWFLLFLW